MTSSGNPAISVRNLSKCYRLGSINRHTLVEEVEHWWHKLRGRDPRREMGKIGQGSATERRRIEAEASGADRFWALRDVSFDIHPGEIVGIIGRNGAGKSTLLKILSRITEPTEGEAIIEGRVGSLLEVGTGFHPELTGRENIYMNGTILGMKKTEITRKYDEIVAFAEIEQFLDTPVKRYSSGMYVRLAFAVAAHLEPEILLVDEVLAVGDAEFQKKCLGKMSEVAGQGRTVLFVSHSMDAVNRLCSRALFVDHGRIASDGPAPRVTGLYLAGVSSGVGLMNWGEKDAPGDDNLRLVGVALLKENGECMSAAEVSDKLTIRLQYNVLVPGVRFRCAILLHTQGVCAFAGLEPRETVRERAGLHTSEVDIPAHLLAEGEYLAGVSIFTSAGKKHHFVNKAEILRFQIYDPMKGDSARGDYAQTLGGVVRPKLNWRIQEQPMPASGKLRPC